MVENDQQVIAEAAAVPEQVAPMEISNAILADRIASLEKQVAFLPPQVRMLAAKVDGLTAAIAEPRIRSLLTGLLGVFDLTDQVLRTLPPAESTCDEDHRRNYQVLRTQIEVLLNANGLMQIPAAGAFDPQLHKALQSVPVDHPAQDGMVLEIVRPGFRTEQAVLRYAEVLVGRFTARAAIGAPAPAAAASAPTAAAAATDSAAESSVDVG
jgi:molecular chaperone GrpE (heat shock protein)